MSRTILSRLGAGLVATALVAGGSLLVAAPASAVNDIVTPTSVVENSWGHEGTVTVTGTGTVGDALEVDLLDSDDLSGTPNSYLSSTAVIDTVVQPDGTYTITFSVGDADTPSDFFSFPELGDTVFAVVFNDTRESEPIFLPIAVTAFAVAPQNVIVDPICLSGDAVRETGVSVFATGFGQYEEISYAVTDAAGTAVPGDDNALVTDETGSVGPAPLTLFSTAGNIPDGSYTITFTGSVTTAGVFAVGPCDAPAVPVVPAAVVAAPQLANTGSSDAGILVGGSALLLLVGAALVAVRRRQNAAA